jgi:hypothetical protein
MSKRLICLSAAAVVIAAASARADAQVVGFGGASPVSITAFSIVDSSQIIAWNAYDFTPPSRFVTGDVTLTFVNTSDKSATCVKFVVDNGRHSQRIVDKGTFSPGVAIEHDFVLRGERDSASHATSKVDEVDFADGSTWHAVQAEAANR